MAVIAKFAAARQQQLLWIKIRSQHLSINQKRSHPFGLILVLSQDQTASQPTHRRRSVVLQVPAAAKGGNTSNLFSHLEMKHPTEYAALKSGITASTEASSSRPRENRQRTIVEAVAANQKYTRSSKRWQQLTNSVTHCLAKDMMPIYSVEKPGLKKCCKSLTAATNFQVTSTLPTLLCLNCTLKFMRQL